MPECNHRKDKCLPSQKTRVPVSWESIEPIVIAAIEKTVGEKDLFDFGVSERTVCGRLAYHLQTAWLSSGWTVDCEYNRAFNDPKKFTRESIIKAIESYPDEPLLGHLQSFNRSYDTGKAIQIAKGKSDHDDNDSLRNVVPDIVVHRRGCDCQNILVVETKVNATSNGNILFDWAKLTVFTNEGPYQHPVYNFGLYVDFKAEGWKAWLFYKNGGMQQLPGSSI